MKKFDAVLSELSKYCLEPRRLVFMHRFRAVKLTEKRKKKRGAPMGSAEENCDARRRVAMGKERRRLADDF